MLPLQQLEHQTGLVFGESLGKGGFGAVYQARHQVLDVDVAVKLIDASALDASGMDRALREARLMARLDHPNLLRIFDAGLAYETVYLVLELMNGGSYKGVRSLPAGQAVSVAKQLLSGLQSLHDARILHRDIKPANCLHRAHDDRVKLADLGIATDLVTVAANYDWAGTIPFMAPELFDPSPKFSPASDLYALGITLACLLMPVDPFPSGSFNVLRDWALSGTRPQISNYRTDLPRAFIGLIERLIAPKAEDRPTNAAEALAMLSTIEIPPEKNSPAEASFQSTRTFPGSATPVEPRPQGPRIGAWELGEIVYSSTNWLGQVATHIHTGKPARLIQLQPKGPLAEQSEFILAAAERSSRLSHPNLVDVIDWGLHDGRAFVVTAAQGRTLQDLTANGQPLDEHVAIPFMAALTDALVYLHAKGFVYQLVDPGSTIVGSDARSALLSWPVFCIQAGSPSVSSKGKSQRFFVKAYGAPEVLHGDAETIEPSVDLFGLGATFVYLLAGKKAYMTARLIGQLPDPRKHSPSITAPFVALLTRLTNPNPELRPSAIETKAELTRIAQRLGITLNESRSNVGGKW